jgi:hypothetical protein
VRRETGRGDVYVDVGVGEEAFGLLKGLGGVGFMWARMERKRCRVSQRIGVSRSMSRQGPKKDMT